MNKSAQEKTLSAPAAAILGWLLPGLGHWCIGERRRAVIFFVVTGVTFWAGVAVGGVRSTVTVKDNGLWFLAQICNGPQTLGALAWGKSLAREAANPDQYKGFWPSLDIGVVYAGIAGLMNLLIILDVLARVDARQNRVSARAPPKPVR